jgi:hypothetical protein
MAEFETKSQFAERVGLSRGRITQLVKRGLPLCPEGKRVDVDAALQWMSATLDPAQTRAQRRSGPAPSVPVLDDTLEEDDADPLDGDGIPEGGYDEARRRHEWLKVQKARLLLEQARGNLAPWAEVNDALAEWAGREREAWLRWAASVVPALSAEIKVDGAVLAPALRRAVEDHIRTLASEAAPRVGP